MESFCKTDSILGLPGFERVSDCCGMGQGGKLTPHNGDRLVSADAVSPDGRALLITCKANRGTENVALFELATKQAKSVTDSEWAANGGAFSPDNRHFTYVE